MDSRIKSIKKQVRDNIQFLIDDNKLDEAMNLIEEYITVDSQDIDIYSMKSVVLIMKGNVDEAERVLKDGLTIDEKNFDLNYNLGYLYGQQEKFNDCVRCYKKALESCEDEKLKIDISDIIEKIISEHNIISVENKKKIAFFAKQGLDSFLGDIINGLSDEYETRKIIVSDYKQIDEGMQWADICWFEWCDEIAIYGSKLELAKEKKIICRLHRYEVFTDYPKNVIWNNVDKLIIVTDHLKKFLTSQVSDIDKNVDIITINNGVNIDKYQFKERKSGFNIAYVGYIHSRKNPVLLLQIMNELVKKDKRYKLYIAGHFQEPLVELYWNYQIKQMKLEKNIIFEGWQNDISKWLENKNYILSTSIHESFGYGIAEAMSRGIKPSIHNFLFADEVWDKKYLFNSISEAVEMIDKEDYNSKEYRSFIEYNYSLEKQIKSIKELLRKIYENKNHSIDDITFQLQDIKQKLNQKTAFNTIEDLTLFIPTYNRADILKSDLENGLKLLNQRKLIIDDGSDIGNRELINGLTEKKNNYGIEKLITNSDNKGVAKTLKSGINNTKTKYVQFCDDDDILICNNDYEMKKNMKKVGEDFSFTIPRYIVNLDSNENLSLGYDRIKFQNLSCLQILRHLCITGEMEALRAGGIFKTETLKTAIPESIFKVSEDYVMISRVLSQFIDQKINVSDSYFYIRRVGNNTISKRVNKYKLFLNLFSMLVSGFYCFENNAIFKNEFISSIKQRGELLQKIYGEGNKSAYLLVSYLMGEISIKKVLDEIRKDTQETELSILNIPEEIFEILKYTKY